jgi:hypothetical protein
LELIKGCFATSIILERGRALSMAFSGNGALFAISSETDVSVYET